jgi:hypothetical protein
MAQTASEMTNGIVSVNLSSNTYYAKEGAGLFTPAVSGIYYFGFQTTSSSSFSNDVFLDDIVIQQTPPPPPCTANVLPVSGSNITSQPIQLTWHKVNDANSYDVMISENGGGSYSFVQTVFDTTFAYASSLPDTTYYWYVIPKNGGVRALNCSSNATSFKTKMADECSTAIHISNGGIFNGATTSATPSLNVPSCTSAGATNDVWYSFITTYNELAFEVVGGANFKPVVSVYKGTCGALTQVLCETSGFDSIHVYIYIKNISPGTYYIRIYNGRLSTDGTFTITTDVPVPLPVKIVSFKGVNEGAINRLTWITQTEQNNKGFELQRSADGEHFISFAFMQTKADNGYSTSVLNYDYDDIKPLNGNNFYRLRQVDKDYRASYSNIVFLRAGRYNVFSFSGLYPNPAKDKMNVVIASDENDRITLLISDIAGKVIEKQMSEIVKGNNYLSVNTAGLSPGVYFIKAICSLQSHQAISRFTKQ